MFLTGQVITCNTHGISVQPDIQETEPLDIFTVPETIVTVNAQNSISSTDSSVYNGTETQQQYLKSKVIPNYTKVSTFSSVYNLYNIEFQLNTH